MARPTLGAAQTERVHLKMPADEIAMIDEWKRANRVQSRSEAIRQLCRAAIVASKKDDDS